MKEGKTKFKLIAVSEQNYTALRLLGHVPESFNDVVTKLLQSGFGREPVNQTAAALEVVGATSPTTQ